MTAPTQRTWRLDDPFSGGTIAISGWDWGGDQPIALLSHANGFCGAMWGLVAESLRADYRVIAIDLRGHGDSQAPEVPDGYDWDYFASDLAGVAAQLLQETGRTSIDYGIGNSLGGIDSLDCSSALRCWIRPSIPARRCWKSLALCRAREFHR